MLNALVDASLRYKVLVLVAFAVLIGLGILAYRQVPVDAFPDVTPAQVNIYTESPGVAAEDIEKLLTVPIEGAMAGLAKVEVVRSVSLFGLSYVGVYFEDDVDIGYARRLVGEKLQEVKGRLPAGYGEPVLGPNSSGLGQVFWYTIEDADKKLSAMDLRTLHDWTVRLILRTAPGVDDVTTWGGHEKQFQVQIDPQRLVKYGISFKDVMERLAANNKQVGGQYLNIGVEQYLVRGLGLVSNAEDIGSIVVTERGGSPIYIRDVADGQGGAGGALRRRDAQRPGDGARHRPGAHQRERRDRRQGGQGEARHRAGGAAAERQADAGLRPHRDRRQGALDVDQRPDRRLDPGRDRPVPVPRRAALGDRRHRHAAAGDAVRLHLHAALRPVGEPDVAGRPGDRHRHDGRRRRGDGRERLPAAVARARVRAGRSSARTSCSRRPARWPTRSPSRS